MNITEQQRQALNEGSFSRLYSNMKNRLVGIMTAYRSGLSHKENKRRNNQLEADLRKLGYSYNKVEGHYKEAKSDKVTDEDSLVIYGSENTTRETLTKQLIELGIKYDQDTILIVDKDNGAFLVGATGNDVNFPKGKEQSIGQFKAKKLADIYSNMGKNNFVFEAVAPSTMCDAISRKLYPTVSEDDSIDEVNSKLINRANSYIQMFERLSIELDELL